MILPFRNFVFNIWIICLYVSILRVTNSGIVVMKGSLIVEQRINDAEWSSFTKWFRNPRNRLKIVRINPAYQKVESISKNHLRIHLTPVACPGFQIHQIVEFDVFHNDTALILTSRPDSLRQKYEGSKIITKLFSQLQKPSTLCCKSIICISSSRGTSSISQLHSKFRIEKNKDRRTQLSHQLISQSSGGSSPLPLFQGNRNRSDRSISITKEEIIEVKTIFSKMYIPGLLNRISISGSQAIQNSLQNNVKRHIEDIIAMYCKGRQQRQHQEKNKLSSSLFLNDKIEEQEI